MTNGRHYAVNCVFPPTWLADAVVRSRMVPNALRNTADKIEGIPRDWPWRIGNIRYGAFIVPHDLTWFTYRAHPLDGKLVAEADVDRLLDELALATEAGEINHLGTWAVEAFGDVIFEETL